MDTRWGVRKQLLKLKNKKPGILITFKNVIYKRNKTAFII